MGKEIEKSALASGHEITGFYDPYFAYKFDQKNFDNAEIVIDFTTPGSAVYNIIKCFEANKPIVVGTTGWYDEMEEVRRLCSLHNGSLLYASNFSIGVNILFSACSLIAKMINKYSNYNVHLFEAHHSEKKDAPSGTAISIANDLVSKVAHYTKWQAYPDDVKASPEDGVLPVYWKREGDIVGFHEMVIESSIDRLSIEHQSFSRSGFAAGTLIATEWLIGKKGIFTMKDIFEENK